MDIKHRKVTQFRCHIDPMIPPKPRNSFDLREMKNAVFELTPVGIYVGITMKAPGGISQLLEHIVPFANVQSIKLEPLDEKEDKKAT